MTKLTRVTGKTFGETATATGNDPEIGQFGSALLGTYNGTTDVATIQNLPAWSNGFIGAVTPTNQYPPLPEMTGVLKVLSYQENYILQQGLPEWDSATDYHNNGFCAYNGIIYKSIQNNNTNHNPSSSPTYWTVYGAITDYANQYLNNLNPAGYAKLQYVPFAINSGSVNASGENNTLTYSGSTVTCAACTVTTVDGITVTDSEARTWTAPNTTGTAHLFKNTSSNAIATMWGFHVVKALPATPGNYQAYLNIATIPASVQYYDGANWIDANNLVYLGTAVLSAGTITAVNNRKFNDSGFVLNRYADSVVVETYVNGTEGYRVWSPDSTGYRRCEQWGYKATTANAVQEYTITFLKSFADTNFIFERSPYWNVNNVPTDSILDNGYRTKTTNNVTFFMHESSLQNGTDWFACGYIV